MKKFLIDGLIPCFLLLLPFVLPIYSFKIEIGTILTIVGLLFAILVGFFIATASANHLRLQALTSSEDGALMSLYNLVKLIDPKSTEKIKVAIDNYLITALNFEVSEYINNTTKELEDIVDVVDNLDVGEKLDLVLAQNIHIIKTNLYTIRQEIALATRKVVTFLHWIIIISLEIILFVLILNLRDGLISTNFLIGLLIVASYYILVLVHQVDSNQLSDEGFSYKNSQRIFDLIGKLKYLPEEIVKNNRIEHLKGDYRIGKMVNGRREIVVMKL